MVESILFTLAYVTVPLIALFFLRAARLSISKISLISAFFVYYIATAYAGVLPLYLGWDLHAIRLGATSKEIIFKYFGYSSYCLLAITGSCYLCSRVEGIRIVEYNPKLRKLSNIALLTVLMLILVCALVLAAYLRAMPGIPLIAAIKGDFSEAILLRTMAASTGGIIKSQYYVLFYRVILSFLVYLLFSNALFSRTKTAWLFFSVCFCLALLASLVDAGKGQLILLLFGLLITYLLSKNKKANLRYVAVFLAILFILSSIMMVFFMGAASSNFVDLFFAVLGRICSGNMIPAYHVLEMFQYQDYLWGRSFPNPRGIFPFEQFILDNEVWLRIFPQPPGSQLQYAAPSVFWAEMYANFGPIGPLYSAPLVGAVLYWIQSLLSRLPSSPVKYALITWCSIHFMGLAAKTLLAYVVLDYDLYVIVTLALLLLLLDGKGRITVCKAPVRARGMAA